MLSIQSSPPRRHPTHVYMAGILQMVIRNGIAGSMNRPRPCTIEQCNNLRTQLLQDDFFDREHQPEELEPRMRPGKVLFSDLVVLMAQVMRVLMRPGLLTAEEEAERVKPFFDKEKPESRNPFSDPSFEDEGCVA
ncbi:hypothetical protein LTR17_005471 [Elasticomyces elasticus]|nr:hypothetical protein LTR17_005471 [Elasticomyces elasticus]